MITYENGENPETMDKLHNNQQRRASRASILVPRPILDRDEIKKRRSEQETGNEISSSTL